MEWTEQSLEPTCAFCGSRETRVRRLVVGLHVAICADCVDIAREILHDSEHDSEDLQVQSERQDREWLEAENRRLRELLRGRGIDPGQTPS